MIREVNYNGTIIEYELTYKRVKNINLRVKPDLSVSVSANRRVSKKRIDAFVLKKADFILNALDSFKERNKTENKPLYSLEEFSDVINRYYNDVLNIFLSYNIDKPVLKMRKMKSRWGSCNYVKGIITLNKNLIYCTKEQIYYVIVHEFAHLLVHNHSEDFYNIVKIYVPDYKRIIKEMNSIVLGY